MNDPNGLFYLDCTWHLFFQYYPHAPVHGPMYWGHATSCDLVCWEEQPIALCPQGAVQIFSGSAVVDYSNSAGFAEGTGGTPPIVAIYTGHDTEAVGPHFAENQCLAYSLDGGTTWTQYAENPVLVNPGVPNFRDPKVSWDAARGRWLMVLAAGDRVHFYSSADLKAWTFLSEFGSDCGAHGGVWECPDLFALPVRNEEEIEAWETADFPEQAVGSDSHAGADAELGFEAAAEAGAGGECGCVEEKWVLLVSVNPGGPNEGSATQYFVGDFDGKTFTPDECCAEGPTGNDRAKARAQDDATCDCDCDCSAVRWVDWGRDNYAGVTFNNVPSGRRVMIGWMSNWDYAAGLPTVGDGWCGQMTFPRELSLAKSADEGLVLQSYPAGELWAHCDLGSRIFRCGSIDAPNADVSVLAFGELDLTRACLKLSLHGLGAGRTTFTCYSGWGEALKWGIDNDAATGKASLFIDRSSAGLGDLPENFPVPVMTAPLAGGLRSSLRLCVLLDKTSIEVFANWGERTLTALAFPTAAFNRCCVCAESAGVTFSLEAYALRVNNCEP